MILVGILFVGLGIVMMVARDFFWALTEIGNSFAGRQSERTELWEAGQIIGGLITVGIGAFVICAGTAEAGERDRERLAPTQTAVAIETFAATLDEALGAYIEQWERDASAGIQVVDPANVDFRADEVYYGRCDDGQFFAAIKRYEGRYGTDYMYLREGRPVQCSADGMRVYGGEDDRIPWRPVTLFVDRLAVTSVSNATLEAVLTPLSPAIDTEEAIITETHARTLMPRAAATRDAVGTQQAAESAIPAPTGTPASND